MMSISDNRTTRGFVRRYGLAAIQNTATIAGMANTTIGQARMGCGWRGGRNSTTLQDLGRLYENIENGSVLNDTNNARTEFYQPMNSSLGGRVQTIVNQEAAAQGKSGIANQFFNNMANRVKGGSYDIPCGEIVSPCSTTFLYFRGFAGTVSIPAKNGVGAIVPRVYVYGRFVDSLVLNNGASTATYDNLSNTIDAEILRTIIRSALTTW
jgi:beta-lactamase family protein